MENAPAPSAQAPQITSWPGAFKAFGPSREAVGRNLSTLVLLVVVAFVGSFVLNAFQKGFTPAHPSSSQVFGSLAIAIVMQIISSLFGAFITGAQIKTYLAGVRGQRIEFGEAAKIGWPLIWNLFLLSLLVSLSVLAGLLLLIVPGFIILVRLILAPYFMVDQKLGVLDAYKASWNATKGHSGKLWGIIGVNVLMCLPVITIIGILVTIYLIFMYSAASALLYQFLLSRPADAQPTTG
jgi:hypothetical protein